MIRPHALFLLFVLALALVLFLRPREQMLRIDATPAHMCLPPSPPLIEQPRHKYDYRPGGPAKDRGFA